ncbi:MAG: hypothetical protein M1824_001932 [Vezdaea acicularis]|nr:MAG: hypothetical protein M1824_001932 [Vezdaea acicularis]
MVAIRGGSPAIIPEDLILAQATMGSITEGHNTDTITASRTFTEDTPVTSEGVKPEMLRRATEPISRSTSLLIPNIEIASTTPQRPRTRSPFSRSHLRSRSSASALTPPIMTRSHSMPVNDAAGRVLLSTTHRPSSPSNALGRYRSPSRRSAEEFSSLGLPSLPDIGENVSLDTDTDSTPRASDSLLNSSSPLLALSSSNTFPRRYRPSSPLRPPLQQPSPMSAVRPRTPTSAGSSPHMSATKFNEPYPTILGYPASFSSISSLPSTPTSARSRSPSISSLETIPDSPDAEQAALEADAERIASLKEAADAIDREGGGSGVSGSGDNRRGGLDASGKIGFGFGTRDKKKRWSVCGAEKRTDLDLETIWED